MELKTLWLGLLVSAGAFAVKTGLGWGHALAGGRPGRLAARAWPQPRPVLTAKAPVETNSPSQRVFSSISGL